jgi:ABC-type lipoprotein release transport system permease subunit
LRIPTLITLSAKYLYRYRRRYFFLFLALCLGFGIVTLMTGIKDGMYANVYRSAQDHYAGDIVAVGYDSHYTTNRHFSADAKAEVYRAIDAVHLDPVQVVERTWFGEHGVVYYNGTAVRVKYVIGVDWDKEASYFDSLNYQDRDVNSAGGATGGVSKTGEDSIILSAPLASQLNARVGDSLVVEVNTRYGQKNTGYFIVGGIVEDATLFGYYKVYISRVTLNRLMLFDDGDCSFIGIFLENRRDVEKKRSLLQGDLEKRMLTGPLVYDRDEYNRATDDPFEGFKVFLITIPVFLSEVADLLDAINLVSYFLFFMMLIIMMVSALVTYQLILHERRRELGTMRAIGFYGAHIRLVLALETLGLALVSLAAGAVLVLVLQWVVTFIPFSWFPSFEIFLEDGKLKLLYLPATVAVNILAVFASLFLAAVLPVFGSSREPLPAMLSGGR